MVQNCKSYALVRLSGVSIKRYMYIYRSMYICGAVGHGSYAARTPLEPHAGNNAYLGVKCKTKLMSKIQWISRLKGRHETHKRFSVSDRKGEKNFHSGNAAHKTVRSYVCDLMCVWLQPIWKWKSKFPISLSSLRQSSPQLSLSHCFSSYLKRRYHCPSVHAFVFRMSNMFLRCHFLLSLLPF